MVAGAAVRGGVAGLVLLAVAAGVWLTRVPPARERALALARERAPLEQERLGLVREVAELEQRLDPEAAAGPASTLGPVALRAAVVEALGPLGSAQGVRLDVSADADQLSLSLSGELDEVLTLIDRLTYPDGPLTLARVTLRPRGQDGVQVQVEALQPGAGR